MGLIRSGLVLFLGILLFVSFLAMNTFVTFSSSLSYENVREGVYPLVQGLGDSSLPEDIVEDLNLTKIAEGEKFRAENYCQRQNMTVYNFSYKGFIIDIPCETIYLGVDSIINETISDVVYGIYYTRYDCNFWSCFSENQFPFFLISQKAHDYWKGKFYLLLIVSLILAVLIFLFIESRSNAPIIIGILLALSALPILKLSSLFSAFLGQPMSFIIGIFFIKANVVFWISFIIGLVLIAIGIASRIMNFEFMKKLIQKKPEEKQSKTMQSSQQKPSTQLKIRKKK
ncbi:MAG: hypothetical protein ABH840_01495 [Nanoarchaeota archaeon]